MSNTSTNVLIDRIPVGRNIATDAIWVVAFSLVTAACAQIGFQLPFTPVPITGQTFAVLLSGVVLGWRRGFLSQVVYLAEGAAGFPVFADGAGSALHLAGPSGGFLLCFPLAAALVGLLVEFGVGRSPWKMAGALASADLLILVAGSTWMRVLFHLPFSQAWLLGFYPFLLAEVVKVLLLARVLPPVMQWLDADADVAAKPHTGFSRSLASELFDVDPSEASDR